MKKWKSQPCFDTKSVRFGRAELSFFWPNPGREIYNLGMVSGPVLFKTKGNSWIFILVGVKNEITPAQHPNSHEDETTVVLVSVGW